jgi:hypothetical protein
LNLHSLSKHSFVVLFLFADPAKIFADQPANLSFLEDCRTSQKLEHSWEIDADFLYWFPSEEVSNIWADIITITPDNSSSWKAPSFDLEGNYGFRLGADHKFGSDGWDFMLGWTWFRTSSTHTLWAEPDQTVSAEFFAAFLGNLKDDGGSVTKTVGQWTLLFNMFDGNLGRNFQVSRSLSIRPFLGLKGGYIHQPIEISYLDIVTKDDLTQYSGQEHLKNNFWGVGPAGGVNTAWMLSNFRSHFISLFGDFCVATMWGRWTCSDVYNTTLGTSYVVDMKNSSLGTLMCSGFLGMGWDAYFNECSSCFHLKLGYEMQIWINQFRLSTFQLQRLHGDLTLQGLTLKCAFEF